MIFEWLSNRFEKWCINQGTCDNCKDKCCKKHRKYIKQKRKELKEQNNE